ncbi:far upstream element-binding protein [Dioscorea alata]|uniref:Far upstream element-binding protein n=1 Tax=Dioscorea alata TaxID=55571 RepID=A0ACB7WBL1_DIOAL|nr:far upstream element-binding protein [Dioscorea alata]
MAEPEIAAAEIPPSTDLDASASAPEPINTEPEPEPESRATAPEAQDGEESPKKPEEDEASLAADHKRKHEELEPQVDESAPAPILEAPADEASKEDDGGESEAKRQRVDGDADGAAVDGANEAQELEAPAVGNGQLSSAENVELANAEDIQNPDALVSEEGNDPSAYGASTSRKIEVPSNKVGVLIGKSGETIKNLQINSGAKIQITRDADADPRSATRPVELIGKLEDINRAERLIKAVIAEADAGGSPSLVARGFDTTQTGAEQVEIQVPNEKVGLVIGKGGETIKNLQTKSGARIQLIPQHLPEGDLSKERTVRVTGNKRQIEVAKELIKDVLNQVPTRPSSLSGGYNQQSFRARGPTTSNQWGPRAPPQSQMGGGYDYQQRGMYPSQNQQYPSQPYGGYSQQPPPRSSFGSGWEQRSGGSAPPGSYDYYGQGGRPIDGQPPNVPAQAPPSSNYHYGQPQGPMYGQPPPYGQSAPTQPAYGHGYDEPKYDGQAPNHQYYGQPPTGAQQGAYSQQAGGPPSGYGQQPYGKPPYDVSSQGVPQSYGPPRANQPADSMYHGPTPAYGSGGPQSYPYGSGAPAQPPPSYGQPYGPSSGTVDGYNQQPAGYSQHGGQTAPGYGQGGQPAPAYPQQGAPPAGYGQYPPSQPGYGDQAATNNANYGYQGGSTDGSYGNNAPNAGYGTAPVSGQPGYGQAGYGQPPPTMPGYDQSVATQQPGYGAHPSGAPATYTKSLSPQPGYGSAQYDSAQMYGHH